MSVVLNSQRLSRIIAAIPSALSSGMENALSAVLRQAGPSVDIEDAHDTYALQTSFYKASGQGSGYTTAATQASAAYRSNPTNWPDIRASKIASGDAELELAPEIDARGKYTGYVASAAAHAVPVEEGYVSWYGNDVPPRPVALTMAHEGFSDAVGAVEAAILAVL